MADEGGITTLFLFATLVAALGSSFQYGYNVGVVNAPEKAIEKWMIEILQKDAPNTPIEEHEHNVIVLYSLIVSIFCLGGMLGGLLLHKWALWFGLKNGIVVNNILVFVAAGLMGYSKTANNYYLLFAGRFIVGVNAGLGAGLTPMYLTEISPVALRGTIGSIFQLFLTVSILIAQIVGLDFLLGNDDMWPYLFYLIAVMGLFQLIFLPFCADSPRSEAQKGKVDEAKKALIWLRGTDDVDAELEQIQKEIAEEQETTGDVRLSHLFSRTELLKPLVIACMLMIGQQLSGINAIIFYSTSTFQDAGLGSSAQLGTLCIGAVNVVMTVISTAIVDKAGRKPLLLISFGAMAIDTALFFGSFLLAKDGNKFASYLCVLFLMLFIIFFATGLGSIPWFMISELFPQNARSTAISIVIIVHWLSNFTVGLSFPIVQKEIGPYVFLIFCIIQVGMFIYVLKFVPETKNRTIDEIASDFKNK